MINNTFDSLILVASIKMSQKQMIGSGAFSNVFRCTRKDTGVACAVKVIDSKRLTAQQQKTIAVEVPILQKVRGACL